MLSLAASALSIVALQSAPVVQPSGTRYAIIIGIDTYSDSNDILPLSGADADAQAIKAALVKHAQFRSENIRLLTSRDPNPGNRPTNDRILETLAWLQSSSKSEDDTIFVFFAGHGVSLFGAAYIMPQDVKASRMRTLAPNLWRPEQLGFMAASQLQSFYNFRARTVIAAYDMCRNDPLRFRRNEQEARGFSRFFGESFNELRRGIAVEPDGRESAVGGPLIMAQWMATLPGEFSFEDPAKRRGNFSLVFEEAISGGADSNRDGKVTLGEMNSFLDQQMVARFAEKKQRPVPKMEGPGVQDFVFSWSDPTKLPAPATGGASGGDAGGSSSSGDAGGSTAGGGAGASGTEGARSAEVAPSGALKGPGEKVDLQKPPKDRVWDFRDVVDVYPDAYQAVATGDWTDIVSGEGGFTMRLPFRTEEPPKRTVDEITVKFKVKEGGKDVNKEEKVELVSYRARKAKGFTANSFGVSYVDYPHTNIKSADLMKWAENLLRDKNNMNSMQQELDELFQGAFGGALASILFGGGGNPLGGLLGGVLGGGNRDKGMQRTILDRQYREFPGKIYQVVRAAKGGNLLASIEPQAQAEGSGNQSVAFLQIITVGNRVYFLREFFVVDPLSTQEEGVEAYRQLSFVNSFNIFDGKVN